MRITLFQALSVAVVLGLPAVAQEESTADQNPAETTEPIVEKNSGGTAVPADADDTPLYDDIGLDTVVATVGDDEITVGHMIAAKARLPEQYRELPDDVLFGALVEQLVQQTAVAATGMGDLSPAAEYALENERRQLEVAEVLGSYLENAVTEDAVRRAYDRIAGGAEPEKEYRASHILVESEEEALKLVEQLADGANFAKLAQDHSTGPSGPSGGDLGWFGEGMMVPEFEQAVVALQPGETSSPVQSQFGWHVIQLVDVRDKAVPPLEEIRDQIVQQLQEEAIQNLLSDAVAAADVTRVEPGQVPTSVLSDPSLLAD